MQGRWHRQRRCIAMKWRTYSQGDQKKVWIVEGSKGRKRMEMKMLYFIFAKNTRFCFRENRPNIFFFAKSPDSFYFRKNIPNFAKTANFFKLPRVFTPVLHIFSRKLSRKQSWQNLSCQPHPHVGTHHSGTHRPKDKNYKSCFLMSLDPYLSVEFVFRKILNFLFF